MEGGYNVSMDKVEKLVVSGLGRLRFRVSLNCNCVVLVVEGYRRDGKINMNRTRGVKTCHSQNKFGAFNG